MVEMSQARMVLSELMKNASEDRVQLCILFVGMQVALVAKQIGKLEQAVSKLDSTEGLVEE